MNEEHRLSKEPKELIEKNWMVVLTPLVPVLGRERQVDL